MAKWITLHFLPYLLLLFHSGLRAERKINPTDLIMNIKLIYQKQGMELRANFFLVVFGGKSLVPGYGRQF